ncbi:MAG: outer membrane beta-barrel protein, partial [Sphingobacteriaceae bacterium]
KLFGIYFLLMLLAYTSYAQENWGGGVDNDDVHFGFGFQFSNTEFKLYKAPNWRIPFPDPDNGGASLTSPLVSISSPASSGFGLGFIADVRLGNNVNFRATPALVFADRFIDYTYEISAQNTRKTVQSATVDLPLGFKLKSDRRRNFRAYILGGIKYSIDIISKKKLDDDTFAPLAKLVKINRNVLWYEAGIGFDFYFEFFKLSPEIKWSQSMNNVLAPTSSSNAYGTPLEKLFLRNFQFSLYFE